MPLSEEETLQRAFAALHSGDLSDAERLFRQILQARPNHIGALNLLAIVLMRLRRLEEAEHYARLALQAGSTSDVTFHNYGLILRALGRSTEALQQFSQALAINPSVTETWNNRGAVLNELNRYGEANEDFARALKLNPRYAEAHCNKAAALANLGRFVEASSAYADALAIDPGLVDAWLGRGKVCCELERYDDALAAFDKAVTLKPDFAEAWVARGDAYFAAGQYDDAIKACDQALTLKPDLAEARIGRRRAFAALEQSESAGADYDLSTVEFTPRQDSPLAVHITGERSSSTVKLVADLLMCPIVLERHRWQAEELEFAKRVCAGAEPIVLVDVGANMGLFSRQLLAALPAIVEAFAYEPEAQNFACLVHNLEPFGGKVKAIQAALSNKPGKMQFYLDPINNGNFSLNLAAMPAEHIRTSVEVKDVGAECADWMERGRRVFYKSDTQGFDEVIATAIRPELWPRVFAGIMEVWQIDKPSFSAEVLAAILDRFPNKVFLANADLALTEVRVTTDDVLTYIKGNDGMHRDLGFWR